MHLSRVDLPEPLCPRIPTVSPSLITQLMSCSASNSTCPGRCKRRSRSFNELTGSVAMRNDLETASTETATEASGITTPQPC